MRHTGHPVAAALSREACKKFRQKLGDGAAATRWIATEAGVGLMLRDEANEAKNASRCGRIVD